MRSCRFRGGLTVFREGGKQPQRKETRPWVFAVGRAPLSVDTTGLSWGLGEWVAGFGLLLMWGTCCRSNGHGDIAVVHWDMGVGGALRCKHFDARGKREQNRPDGPAKMSYGAIGKAGAGASGSYRATDFVSCRNLRKRCGCELCTEAVVLYLLVVEVPTQYLVVALADVRRDLSGVNRHHMGTFFPLLLFFAELDPCWAGRVWRGKEELGEACVCV